MKRKCNKCGYERNPLDPAPEYECPRCGSMYPRAESTQQKSIDPGHHSELDLQCEQGDTGLNQEMLRELNLLIRSRYGLIWIDTIEEERTESLMKYLADSLNLPLFLWNLNTGLHRDGLDNAVYGTADPKMAFDHIVASSLPAVYCFQGLSPFFDDALLKAKLTNLARFFSEHEGALIITGNDIRLPEEAKPYSAYFTPPAPTRQDYARLLKSIYNDLKDRMPLKVDMDRQDMNRLLNNLQGLSLLEAGKILTKAMIEDGSLSPDDISLVVQAKKSIVERDGLLEYFPTSEGLADIADLKTLKAWLAKRKSIIINSRKASQFGLIFPKGILLLGVPGSGKSLCAKAVAREWGLPLLKMDPSGLYNKYIGESEKNFSRAMQAAEKMAPVILWIDEIEKAFASGGSEDGGVSQRVLGIFLSWMQERKGEVFVVATCNDVAKLPPELLRKGRFDELFFVDLPDNETRSAIFKIHLKKRGRDPQLFDFGALAEVTDGFSGAEIEQVVISALYDAFSDETPLNTELLLEEARRTYPLSRTRAEHIEALRKWARGRTVGAN